jgi:hypothetical protein
MRPRSPSQLRSLAFMLACFIKTDVASKYTVDQSVIAGIYKAERRIGAEVGKHRALWRLERVSIFVQPPTKYGCVHGENKSLVTGS